MIATLVVACLFIVGIVSWISFNPRINIYSRGGLTTNKKVIALTFDDGPNPKITPMILDVLNKADVKATFFVVGKNAVKYPNILLDIFKNGHQIANHSNRHSYSMLKPPRLILEEVNKTNESVFKIIKYRPIYYRPPYGFRTWWGARALSKAGYKIITWDNMTYDYWGIKSNKLVNKIVKRAKPGGIIVLHDGVEGLSTGNSNVVEALPEIIRRLKSNGYKFISISELFKTDSYK